MGGGNVGSDGQTNYRSVLQTITIATGETITIPIIQNSDSSNYNSVDTFAYTVIPSRHSDLDSSPLDEKDDYFKHGYINYSKWTGTSGTEAMFFMTNYLDTEATYYIMKGQIGNTSNHQEYTKNINYIASDLGRL